ncbi:MAG: hypothetical protein U0175_15320 [Caldilineaceae bacterium]
MLGRWRVGNRQTLQQSVQGLRGRERIALALLGMLIFCLLPVALYAHGGGFPRLNGVEAGPYRVYAWTQPNPWQADEDLHLSVAVTKVDTSVNVAGNPAAETLVTDATVISQFHPPAASADLAVSRSLSATESLGGIYYDTDLRLPATGDWKVDLAVAGSLGSGSANFVVTVLPGRQFNWWLIGGAGAFVLALLVIAAIIGRRRS